MIIGGDRSTQKSSVSIKAKISTAAPYKLQSPWGLCSRFFRKNFVKLIDETSQIDIDRYNRYFHVIFFKRAWTRIIFLFHLVQNWKKIRENVGIAKRAAIYDWFFVKWRWIALKSVESFSSQLFSKNAKLNW